MSHQNAGAGGAEEDDKAALAMARHLVEHMAPGELPLFEETAAALRRERRAKARREDPLGFGVMETSSVLLTAVAYGVTQEVVKRLAENAGRQTVTGLRGWLRGRRRGNATTEPGPDGTEPMAALPPRLLAEVEGIAQRRAVLLGLPPDRADLLAEAVVGYLREQSGASD